MSIIIQYPKISIITPCFNSEKYLEETILSVLDQNYPNLEYIIIDGGSTDSTLDIIKKYKKNIHYWISEKDNGMYDAIQKGFNKSCGEILSWINADDLYHKNSLFIVSEIFNKYQNVCWLTGASTFWDESGRCVNSNRSREFSKYDFLMGDYKWIQQESCFFRRTLYEKVGFCMNTSLKYAGDFELWHRFFKHEKLFVTHALIGGFRMRTSNQLSLEGLPDYLKEVNNILKNEIISNEDKKKIKQYKFFNNILNLIINKLVNCRNRYRKYVFGNVPNIVFNRSLQEFEIE